MGVILFYVFSGIAFTLSLIVVLGNKRRKKIKEYKTPYQTAYDKARADFNRRAKK